MKSSRTQCRATAFLSALVGRTALFAIILVLLTSQVAADEPSDDPDGGTGNNQAGLITSAYENTLNFAEERADEEPSPNGGYCPPIEVVEGEAPDVSTEGARQNPAFGIIFIDPNNCYPII